MSNVTFAKSVDSFVSAQKKGEGAFGTLVEFAHVCIKDVTGDLVAVLKSCITGEEASYRAEHPKMAEFPTSYRSSKSVIMSAVKAGVSLVDEHGKYKGKTQLEKDTKEAKGDSGKSASEKFGIAMHTAMSVFADIDTLEDVRACKESVRILAEMIIKAEAALVAKAASGS